MATKPLFCEDLLSLQEQANRTLMLLKMGTHGVRPEPIPSRVAATLYTEAGATSALSTLLLSAEQKQLLSARYKEGLADTQQLHRDKLAQAYQAIQALYSQSDSAWDDVALIKSLQTVYETFYRRAQQELYDQFDESLAGVHRKAQL